MGIILIVEDEIISQTLLRELVRQEGHTPIIAADGQFAWEFFQQNYSILDVVITDLRMPKMDGYELIEKIHTIDEASAIPIIVQSAYLGVKETALLMEHGIECVMPKPIDGRYMKDYIRRYANRDHPIPRDS